jgi:hypothetical protein
MSEELTEVSHDEIKAFMNEPEEPKAPAPMIIDDWEPEEEKKDHRKTTEEICIIAHKALNAYEGLDSPWEYEPDLYKAEMLQKAAYFISTAANPNGYEECSKMHDVNLEVKLKTGWKYGESYSDEEKTDPYLLPYRVIPMEEKTKDFMLRSIVLALLQVWKGY